MRNLYPNNITMDPSGFVLLSDYIPHAIQEIRYFSTYNFIGERIDGYEEPCALITKEAARALKAVSSELLVQGYRLKVFVVLCWNELDKFLLFQYFRAP